jgi:hypothetical protein
MDYIISWDICVLYELNGTKQPSSAIHNNKTNIKDLLKKIRELIRRNHVITFCLNMHLLLEPYTYNRCPNPFIFAIDNGLPSLKN